MVLGDALEIYYQEQNPLQGALQNRLRIQRAFGTLFVLEHQVEIPSGG